MQLTKNQRVFIVNCYTRTRSYKEVKERFEETFGRASPSKSTIHDTVRKFKEKGTLLNLNKCNSGRLKTVRNEANIATVRRIVEDNPNVSCRRNLSGLSKSSFSRIVLKDLQFHPYKMCVQQMLLDADLQRRRAFCQWFLNQPVQFLSYLVVSDESAFHMNEKINKQNCRHYAYKNSPPENAVFNVSFRREKMSVWAGLCGNGTVIGPIFYERHLDGEYYLQLLRERIIPEVEANYGDHFNEIWWMQDGAPCHRSIAVKNYLQTVFHEKIIALGFDREWPPRSPDLTPCDFYLWGHVKSKVYISPPQTLNELQRRITTAFDDLKSNPRLIRRVIRKMRDKCQKCLDTDGRHVH